MDRIIVTGCGTNVGKTTVSAIVATALNGAYWKPIECGESDTRTIREITSLQAVYEPAYSLKAPLSPHAAARLENIEIDTSNIVIPQSASPLIIETAGGVLVPLNEKNLTLDLFATWDASWIVVSSAYLGSINHTLLTIEALKKRKLKVVGLIFNGEVNPSVQEALLHFSSLPCLGALLPEPTINKNTVEKYAQQWKNTTFGPLGHKSPPHASPSLL